MPSRRRFAPALCLILSLVALGGGPAAKAVPPDPVTDASGREWRQLYETTGLSWNQVAQVCPRDGATACSGTVGGQDLTGWTWGTADQVAALLSPYAPALAAASPPSSARR